MPITYEQGFTYNQAGELYGGVDEGGVLQPPAPFVNFQISTSQSHTSVVTADIYKAGVAIALNLPVVSGSVTIDGRAALRRRCTVTVLDVNGTFAPNDATDTLAPYGNEIVLKRGVPGTLATLGVFRIGTASVSDSGPVTIDLSLSLIHI